MKNFEQHIDNLVQKVLNETLNEKSEQLVSQITEKVETNEKLHGKQHKLDVAKPKGKITSADFKKLRDMKEVTFGDTEDDKVEPYGDFSTEKPKVHDIKNEGEIEERRHSKKDVANALEYLRQSFGKKDRNDFDGRPSKVIGVYSNIDKQRMEEEEATEGNAFSGALAKAKEEGKDSFEVDGKTYSVKEMEMNEKWDGDVEVKQTGEYSDMTIEELNSAIKKLKAQNDKFIEDGKKVPEKNKKKMSQLYFAKRAKQGWKGKGSAKVNESKKTLKLTENEIVDLIEKIINEQKANIEKKKATVDSDFTKVRNKTEDFNDEYLKSVVKKMKDYLKTGSEGSYEENPEGFPVGNGEMKETPKKAYKASDAVEEYIDAFAFPGQTNLVFDEIKPNDEWIEANLKGSSKTGNAQTDEDGKALGNVVPSEVGEKFYKNYEDNVFGAEQMTASYKRYPQPVDQAGESTESGDMKTKKGASKAQSILNQLESKTDKKEKMISEEFAKMKRMISYNKKTQ